MERSPNKKKSASGLGHLLNERTIKTPTFVSPILQQVGKLAASVATVGSELSSKGSATGYIMPRKIFSCCCWRLLKRKDKDARDEDVSDDVISKEKPALNEEDTGNPRNKCALQPGHSLMDWIRLGASGKDLTGLGPQAGRLFVTKQELAKHSKIDDIWLAIRGRVYNVTEYVPFHPGGPEELMKGAGIDATTIFDQVHPWVNYEQILQKCLVGNLVSVEPNVDTERLFFGSATGTKIAADAEKLDENDTNKNTAEPERTSIEENEDPTKRESEEPPISLPRFDWIQKLDYITAIFYLGAFANPLVEVLPPNSDHQVDVSVTIGGKVYKNELAFHENVQWPCSIKMTWETGKLELVFKKSSSRIWENYGKLVQSSSDVSNSKMKFDCVLKKKVQVNHNIYLLGLERNDGGRMVVPVGKHVRVFVNVEGQEISRSYTPVPTSLFDAIALNDSTPDEICLMIKRYEAGLVSSAVTKKQPGDSVRLTKPLGDFDLKRIEKREAFLLLAAGTGITPMLSLLVCLLERRVKKCQFARLLFFNRKTEDIPFKEQLDKLEMADSRLKIDHVLSEPGTDWIGPRGHINKEMINVAIQQHIKDTGYTIRDLFVFVCGPNQFLNLSLDELQSLEISNDQIHVFSG